MPRLLFACVALVCTATPAFAQNPEPLIKRVGALPGELVAAGRTDAEIVDAIFFITLGRLPKEKEKEGAVKLLGAAKSRADAGRDVAWALVNTKEFLKLHGLDKNLAEAQKIVSKAIQEWDKEDKKEQK